MKLSHPSLTFVDVSGPLAHWNATTDTVTFDWPAIERAASGDTTEPNIGIAKILMAARGAKE